MSRCCTAIIDQICSKYVTKTWGTAHLVQQANCHIICGMLEKKLNYLQCDYLCKKISVFTFFRVWFFPWSFFFHWKISFNKLQTRGMLLRRRSRRHQDCGLPSCGLQIVFLLNGVTNNIPIFPTFSEFEFEWYTSILFLFNSKKLKLKSAYKSLFTIYLCLF